MIMIGLTGPTGAGKSTAARILTSMGCAVIDGDALAREITLPGSPVLTALAERFGGDILLADGSLDRALLASRAFADEQSRQDLNAITHPAITALALARAETHGSASGITVVDAAALPESGLARHCERIIVLTAPEEVRLARILARDGISEAAARQRIDAQRHINYNGHTMIDTSEGEAALRHALEQALEEIFSRTGGDSAGSGAADRAAVPQGD